MWLLGHILPLLVGDFVVEEADEHWQLYLQLMEIVDLMFCPKTSHDHAVYVATLISDHHSTFVSFTVARVSYLKCTLWCICLNL